MRLASICYLCYILTFFFSKLEILTHISKVARDENQEKQNEKLTISKSERVFLNAFDDAILTELNLSDNNNHNNLIIIKKFKYNISYQRTIILRICSFVNYFLL